MGSIAEGKKIHELEGRTIEITQFEQQKKQTKKKLKKLTELKVLWDYNKSPNIHVI